MLNFKRLAFFFGVFILSQKGFSQLGFSNEIGVVAGPLQFRSDFGARFDNKTNFGNSGFGVGLVHYMGFSYRRHYNSSKVTTFFNEHFKVRNEISWNKTTLEHLGTYADPSKTSLDAQRLRGHTTVANNIDIGSEFEFFPLNVHDFENYGYLLAPFVSAGVHYTYYKPNVATTFNNPNASAIGDVNNSTNFYSGWAPGSVNASDGSTFSIVSSVGVRYKLSRLSDLMLNLRFQYYLSDMVDGLNHNLESNKSNDWLLWLNVGYIYYLD